MSKHKAILGVFFIFLASLPALASAGAWTPSQGHGVFIQSVTQSQASRGYDTLGDVTEDIDFAKTESQVYMEFGIRDRVALVGAVSLQNQNIENVFGTSSYFGLGEVRAGVRVKVWEKNRFVVSLQPSILYEGQNENYSQLGNTSETPSVEIRALMGYGRTIKSKPIYMNVTIARREGFDVVPNSWRTDLAVGFKPLKKWEVLGQAFWSDTELLNEAPRFALPTESLKGELSLLYHQNAKHVYQFGVIQPISGKSSIRESAYTVGIWRNF